MVRFHVRSFQLAILSLSILATLSRPAWTQDVEQAEVELEADVTASVAAVSGEVSVQGFLEFDGSPAVGLHDFRLRVYDAVSSGAQQGSQHLEGNYFVNDGVFSIAADFGSADFWSGDRWIEIGVRDGLSTGSYEVLSPRTKVLATPLALALPGVYANPSGSFVGIGRSSAITGNEQFGVHSPTTSTYGGMYISTAGVNGLPFYGYAPGGSAVAYHYLDGSNSKWYLYNGGTQLTVQSNGNVGIGTTSPSERLHVGGGDPDIMVGGPSGRRILIEGYSSLGSALRLYNTAGTQTVLLHSEEASGQGSQITLYNSNGTPTVEIDADYGAGTGQPGRITVDELELNGSDLAEHFDIQPRASLPEPEPGMVVSIDPEHPGDLMLSHEAYDRKVVGVISGAGDIRTGIYMSQPGTIADGAHPIAVAGRVYVMANAQNGPIEPGDMLTTSDVAGQAVKAVDHGRSRGAVLGKAMTSLDSGTGLVLLFISQQ